LRGLVLLLWLRRKTFLAIAGSVTGVVVFGSLLSRSVWSGEVVVRVAQFGQLGQVGQPGPQLVEPIPRAAERFKMRDFQNGILRRAGIPDGEDDPEAKLFRSSLRARMIPTDLLRIEVHAYSQEKVRRLLEGAVESLRQIHEDLAVPAIQNLNQQAAQVSEALVEARRDLDALRKTEAARAERAAGVPFEASVYLAALVANKIGEVRGLEQRKLVLDEQLNPGRTYPTSVVDRVRVDPKRAAPRLVRDAAAALVGGCLLAFLIIVGWEPGATESPPP
jgi:hypothetical protein